MTEDERKSSVIEILAILYKIDLSEREAEVICNIIVDRQNAKACKAHDKLEDDQCKTCGFTKFFCGYCGKKKGA